jgi:hypothetical protein
MMRSVLRVAASCPGASKASIEYGDAWRFVPRLWISWLGLASLITLVIVGLALAQPASSPVQPDHLRSILNRFRENGLTRATVVLDSRGRVELQGAYENEREVDLAFSLAQTVVGVHWVSPVIPERIQVAEWMKCLQQLLDRRPCGPPGKQTTVLESPPGPLRNKYAMVVGVSQFQDREINPLKYPAKDATDVYQYLVRPSGGNFRREAVVLLQDSKAVRAEVIKAMKRIQAEAGPDDLVFVYLASHGTPPDKYGGVHLITYDAVLRPREQIWQTSLSEKELSSFIQEVRAKRLIIVLDFCYSNGAFAKVPGFLPTGGRALMDDEHAGYGRSQRYMAQRLLGIEALIQTPPSGSRSLTSASQRWGKILISASGAEEKSWESDRLQNGIFTYYFLDGLVRMQGAVKAAVEYAGPLVHQLVKSEKGSDIDQTPTLAAIPSESDIALVPGR